MFQKSSFFILNLFKLIVKINIININTVFIKMTATKTQQIKELEQSKEQLEIKKDLTQIEIDKIDIQIKIIEVEIKRLKQPTMIADYWISN